MFSFKNNSIFVSTRPLKLFFLVLSLFFYLYGVNFTFLPISTARIIIVIAFCYFLLTLLFKPSIIIRRSGLLLLLIFMVFGYWVIFISIISGFRDKAILTSVILMVIHSLMGGWFFSVLFQEFKFDFRKVIFIIQIVITIQAVFILIYFVSWSFREFTFAYIPETGNIDYRENLFQSRGLTHSSGAMLSVLQSVGVLFSAYLISTVNFRSKEFFYLLFSFGLLCLSIIITGRTGLLMLPLVFIYFTLMLFLKPGIPKNITYFSFTAPLILIASFLIFRYLYANLLGGITTSSGEDILDRIARWYLVEFFDEGRIQSRTFMILSEHWFFPDNTLVLLFGDPATWGVDRISSDIGYVRMWYGIGIIGIIFYYSLLFTVFLQMVLLSKAYPEKIMISILGIYLFFIEMKEPFMFNISVNAFFILIFVYLIMSNTNQKSTTGSTI